MTQLYANPYNSHADGFTFETYDAFQENVKNCYDCFDEPVEEFEIQFVDGDVIDAKLFDAWGVHQGNVDNFLTALDTLNGEDKIKCIALGACGYIIDQNTPINDVDLYYCDSLHDLAVQFIDEGRYSDIPESLKTYIDYAAIARDLSYTYTELSMNGKRLVYRCL